MLKILDMTLLKILDMTLLKILNATLLKICNWTLLKYLTRLQIVKSETNLIFRFFKQLNEKID